MNQVRSLGMVASVLLAACAADLDQGGACAEGDCGSSSESGEGPIDGSSSTSESDDGSGGPSSSGEPDDSTDGDPGGIPCDVVEVLERHCGTCHSASPSFGAPMSLVELEDFWFPALSDPAMAVSDMVLERIFDPEQPMPATGMPEGDRDSLAEWIEAGMPTGATSCEDGDPEPEDPVGPGELPCEPTHVFVAHGDDGDDSAFAVPVVDDVYECFTFSSPVSEPTQATAWAPIIDDERVVHHWILYRSQEALPDGGHGPCNMPSDAIFVAGWAPGGGNFEMPEGVGLEFAGPDDSFILQVHYNNVAGYEDARDRSGVALCTAEEPRPIEAGIVTLGTVSIAIPPRTEGHTVEGTCPSSITSYLQQPLHVVSSFPHMHERGASIRTEILRGGAEDDVQMLVDVPQFDFSNQQFYPHQPEILVQPGDAVRTTCVFDNPTDNWISVGEGTGDEMCFNFAMVYPIDAIGARRQCGLL